MAGRPDVFRGPSFEDPGGGGAALGRRRAGPDRRFGKGSRVFDKMPYRRAPRPSGPARGEKGDGRSQLLERGPFKGGRPFRGGFAQMNYMKTFLLLTGLTALFLAVGRVLGGQQGMITAFGFAVVMNFVSYWFSDKIVLALYRAKPADENDYPSLHRVVRRLCA